MFNLFTKNDRRAPDAVGLSPCRSSRPSASAIEPLSRCWTAPDLLMPSILIRRSIERIGRMGWFTERNVPAKGFVFMENDLPCMYFVVPDSRGAERTGVCYGDGVPSCRTAVSGDGGCPFAEKYDGFRTVRCIIDRSFSAGEQINFEMIPVLPIRYIPRGCGRIVVSAAS